MAGSARQCSRSGQALHPKSAGAQLALVGVFMALAASGGLSAGQLGFAGLVCQNRWTERLTAGALPKHEKGKKRSPRQGTGFGERKVVESSGAVPVDTMVRKEASGVDVMIEGDRGPLFEDVDIPEPSTVVDIPAVRTGPLLDLLILGGGVAGLWCAVALLVKIPGGVRTRVHDDRWVRGEDGRLHWSEKHKQNGRRLEVVTLPAHLWTELPASVLDKALPTGSYAEPWYARDGQGGCPREIQLGALEDGLLDAVQQESLKSQVELVPDAFDGEVAEAEQATYHGVVIADGPRAGQARERLFSKMPAENSDLDTEEPDASMLAVSFDLEREAAQGKGAALDEASASALSLAQQRYHVGWSAAGRVGTLYMRLTAAEADDALRALVGEASPEQIALAPPRIDFQVASQQLQTDADAVLQRLRQGLRLYGLPEEAVEHCTVFRSEPAKTPRLVYADTRTESFSAEVAASLPARNVFLIGEQLSRSAATAGPGASVQAWISSAVALAQTYSKFDQGKYPIDGHFPSNVLQTLAADEWGQRVCEELKAPSKVRQSIDGALADGADQEDATLPKTAFLDKLRVAVQMLENNAPSSLGRWKQPDAEELCRHVIAAELNDETFRAMAASGALLLPELLYRSPRVAAELLKRYEPLPYAGGSTPEGEKEAKLLLAKVENDHDAQAMCDLACKHLLGFGVEKDEAKALSLLTRAAEQGDAESQLMLGNMARWGLGCAQDIRKGVEWYRKGANKSNPTAARNLAWMYFYGDGIEQDHKQAIWWWNKASEFGCKDSRLQMVKVLLCNTPDDWVEQQEAGIDLLKSMSRQSADAAIFMAECLTSGTICSRIERDLVMAANYYKLAVDRGSVPAAAALGLLLEKGDANLPADPERSRKYLEMAANAGHLAIRKKLDKEKAKKQSAAKPGGGQPSAATPGGGQP